MAEEPSSEQLEIINRLLAYSPEDLEKVIEFRQSLSHSDHHEIKQQLVFRNLERQIHLEVYLGIFLISIIYYFNYIHLNFFRYLTFIPSLISSP